MNDCFIKFTLYLNELVGVASVKEVRPKKNAASLGQYCITAGEYIDVSNLPFINQGVMSSNCKILLHENEIVRKELEALTPASLVYKMVGNVALPIKKSEALDLNHRRIGFLKSKLNESNE